MSGSCVTRTTVMPERCSSWKSAMTSTLVFESRLPVGSSARMSCGSLTSARAMATRCCCPPESWLGRVVRRAAEADALERRRARGAAARAWPRRRRAAAARRSRRALVRGSRLKLWKTKPSVWLRTSASSSRSRPRHLAAVEEVAARGRAIEAAEDVHQRRLARARGAHDGDELAPLDDERHVVERVHLDVAEPVDLADVVEQDEWGRHGQS